MKQRVNLLLPIRMKIVDGLLFTTDLSNIGSCILSNKNAEVLWTLGQKMKEVY